MRPYALLVFDWNGTLSNAQIGEFYETFPPLFEGVPDLLRQLQEEGYLMAIATNMSSHALQEELSHYQLSEYFITMQCPDFGYSKPNPEMLNEILDQAGLEAHEALMIGDTKGDMQLASNAGVDSVLIAEAPLQDTYTIKTVLPIVTALPQWLAEQTEQ